MNIMAQLGFELTYNDVTVEHVTQHPMGFLSHKNSNNFKSTSYWVVWKFNHLELSRQANKILLAKNMHLFPTRSNDSKLS